MARLPKITRIRREDIPDAPPWIEKLLTPLNQFMEGVYQALNRGIEFNINLAANIVSFSFTTPVGYATPVSMADVVKFTNPLKKSPQGLLLISIREKENLGAPIYNATSVSWYLDTEGQIRVGYIPGLTASTDYEAKFMVL